MTRERLMDTRARIQRRDRALRAVRGFFHARGFVEADTHQLVPAPGTEPHIDPLAVPVRLRLDATRASTRWLITSPELALKRVVAAGVHKVFQLVHVFRDGERTRLHCPEFTMIEWYRGPGTLADIVDDTMGLIRAVAQAVGNSSTVDVDAAPEHVAVVDAFRRFADIDLDAALDEMAAGDPLALPKRVRAAGESLLASADFDDAFFHVMGTRVEPRIGAHRIAVVERWPAQMAVLARLDDDPRYARRFEAYGQSRTGDGAGGHHGTTSLELCNAYDELTDADEQRARFAADNRVRQQLGKPEIPIDEEFLAALPRLPTPTAGNALGFERLLMLLTSAADIDDVAALPWR